MPNFSYKGRDSQGNATSGKQEAQNQDALVQSLMAKGIIPTEIKVAKTSSGNIDLSQLLTKSIPLAELVIFARQMYSLTRAGIPMIRAIKGLSESSSHAKLKDVLNDVVVRLNSGNTLSASMAAHPHVFASIFVSIVRVGENTGRLDDSFLQIANYLELEMDTRRRIASAVRYPIFVLIAISAAMVILNIFVIPTFANMFNKFGVELPWATRALLASSAFFVNYWHLLIVAVMASIVGFKYYIQTDKGKLRWGLFYIRIPIVGPVIEKTLLSRFARSFSLMLKGGVPLNNSLSLVASTVDNAWMEVRILSMRAGIEEGKSLTITASESGMFTPLILQMISVGDETGQVDDLLLEAAQFYEREVDYELQSLTAKIEPILIGIVAVMVLILALGIFVPMWDMMGVVQG
ncbi:type II secretion system F family protein [Moritella sp. F3]|uniref:type II secretion system F family protein n=1 Tax=Moritella sp. F3 TaxID=2718882 RepID=UPI0018E0FE14|nr:type II secretion system F family protein [Moritella sp. F3]GIC76087.1 MSHA biogenesis protein MshG [Moritella sp. F1]GIC82811.1 MSHA biogenesis protein MshG [Moritella sp. F3]